ncbi:signal peptidase II [Microbacterium sp. CJ77]|uniref:signal peptidase II n=1 Tax=Microbacterium sp. CJ77 TaxID=2079201 RepID=UPI000CD8DF23|nr:signal peptidase II [Microbacterium sp. CJ77]
MKSNQVRLFATACIVAAAVVVVDQATKAAAIGGLSETERIPILGDLLGLQLAFNPGAILSLGSEATWLLTLLGASAMAFLVVAATRARSAGWAAGIGLILGGALGNLIDRLFSPPGFARGQVTDFLAYGNLFIGNLADIALGAGAIVLAVTLLNRSRRTREGRPASTAAGEPNAQVVP